MTEAPSNPVEVIPDEREGRASASGMYMTAYCPGSRQAQAGLAELPDRDKTKEDGNAIHDGLHTDDFSELEMTQKEIAQKLKQMEQDAKAKWMEDFASEIGGKILEVREQRFWVRNPKTLDLVASAKPDVVFVYGFSVALVIDYKSGFKDVAPAERNWQLHTQAIAIKQEFRVSKTIRAAIAHSRISSKFDSVDYGPEDLQRIERDIVQIVWKSEQPNAPRVPGDWCRYCRANGVCKEKAVYDQISGSMVPLRTGKTDHLSILRAVERLTPEEMAFIYRRKPSVAFTYEALKARMLELSDDVLAANGFKKSPGMNLKEITDVGQAFVRLAELLTPEQRMECMKLSRSKAAEFYADNKTVSKEAAQEIVDAAIGDAMRDKVGNPRLKEL